jgi:hypothetical protein
VKDEKSGNGASYYQRGERKANGNARKKRERDGEKNREEEDVKKRCMEAEMQLQ